MELEELEEDFFDVEIKLWFEVVWFVLDISDINDLCIKYVKMRKEEDFMIIGYDGCYSGDMLCYSNLLNSIFFFYLLEVFFVDFEKVCFFGDFEICDG